GQQLAHQVVPVVVAQAGDVTQFVPQGGEQVHAAGGGAGGKLAVVGGGRIDEPAEAGGVAVDVHGAVQRLAEGVAGQVRDVGAGGQDAGQGVTAQAGGGPVALGQMQQGTQVGVADGVGTGAGGRGAGGGQQAAVTEVAGH